MKQADGFGWECLHCDKLYITGYGKEDIYLSTRTYCKHAFFTIIFLQSSKDILFKAVIVVFQFDFILYLDKQVHEIIKCDFVPLPVVHRFFDHITKIFRYFGINGTHLQHTQQARICCSNEWYYWHSSWRCEYSSSPHSKFSVRVLEAVSLVTKAQDDITSLMYLAKITLISITSSLRNFSQECFLVRVRIQPMFGTSSSFYQKWSLVIVYTEDFFICFLAASTDDRSVAQVPRPGRPHGHEKWGNPLREHF